MSENSPTITVTRGSNRNERKRRSSTTERLYGFDASGPLNLVTELVRGARTAWWAGLGVLGVAEDTGARVFDVLVEKGESWSQSVAERTEARAQQLQKLARQERVFVQDIERRVHDEVGALLQRIDIPQREDVEELRRQVDRLNDRVDRLAASLGEEDEESPC